LNNGSGKTNYLGTIHRGFTVYVGDIITAVKTHIMVFWVMTPCNLSCEHESFGERWRKYISSKHWYPPTRTWRHNPENHNINVIVLDEVSHLYKTTGHCIVLFSVKPSFKVSFRGSEFED
jgi:hypothetical protein